MNLFMLIFEKQDPDIRINLQLNPVSIYTKFWTVSSPFLLLSSLFVITSYNEHIHEYTCRK